MRTRKLEEEKELEALKMMEEKKRPFKKLLMIQAKQ